MTKIQKLTDGPQRAWVRLPSGRRIDLHGPTFADMDDTDLSLGFARTFRWGGHSVWPLPMSVAQHSLLVLQIRRTQYKLDPDAELVTLYGGVPWEPRATDIANSCFLQELHSILRSLQD